MFLKSSVSLKQEIKYDRIIGFIRILYTVHWNKVKLDASLVFEFQDNDALSNVKPYLRSMSSMAEEELIEFNNIPSTKNYQIVNGDLPWDVANYKQIDWLLKNHFDFMALISKGLAIEVTKENNPYRKI